MKFWVKLHFILLNGFGEKHVFGVSGVKESVDLAYILIYGFGNVTCFFQLYDKTTI